MKYLLVPVCLLISLVNNAQVVNIPDNNFKQALLAANVDTNGDGEIQTGEAEAVTTLTLHSVTLIPVSNFTGIRSFTNLETFDITSLACSGSSLDVSGLTNLQDLQAWRRSLTAVNVSGCSGLINLSLNENNFSTLDISGCTELVSLSCAYNNTILNDIIPGNIKKLQSLDISGYNNIGNLNLSLCDSFTTLSCDDATIQSLNISGLKKIKKLVNFHYIGSLVAKNCSNLTTLRSSNFTAGVSDLLDVTGCTSLQDLYIQEAVFTTPLDLSSCPNLKYLFLTHTRVPSINLKNGSTLATFVLENCFCDQSPAVINICADDFEIDSIRSQMPPSGPYATLVNISSYCTFLPAGSYNTIHGKARLDLDNNGCDNSDTGKPNVALKITDSTGTLIRYTSNGGEYAHYPYKGIFTLTPYFPYPWFTVTPTVANITFDTANSLVNTTDFCIRPNGIHNDLEITFLPGWQAARPGFDAAYTLVYKNRGSTTLSGSVQINFDNSKLNFISASENVSTQSTGQVSWNYNNLQPFESRTINVTFHLLPPPVNNIGDTINYLAAITPSANDETAFDNSFILPQRVRGSFDPNEKQCLEGSKIDISKIGEYLHYQIHFQNEGTDTAFNIVVADTLSDKLDWNSLELINSSHSVDVRQKNGKAEFIFENIKLPYKAINEPASNGYVAFKIKPKSTVVVGDSLNNTAAIYFDFNMPVLTNRATTIVTNTSTPVPVKVEYFSISSRNNINTLNWKAACNNGPAKFSIERSDDGIHFSSIGAITATAVRCQLPFNFYDNDPVAGKNYYRLRITDADGVFFYSKTLVAGNNKAGLQITATTNNIIYLNSNKQQTAQIKIIAADGKEILNEKRTVVAGSSTINLQIKNAAKGIYTLVIYTEEGETITRRFIK